MLDAFGKLGGLLEGLNDFLVSFSWDPPEPRHLRDNWDEVRFYTALGTPNGSGVHLLGETPYFDQGLAGDIGISTFAEAEVYNPNIAAGNSMEQVIGMYSPNWRARLRPFEFDHFNQNSIDSWPSNEYPGDLIQHQQAPVHRGRPDRCPNGFGGRAMPTPEPATRWRLDAA